MLRAGEIRRPVPAVRLAVSLLGGLLDPIRVVTKVPKRRPSTFVRVSRLGGVMDTVKTDRPFLLFECWAEGSAESLACDVVGLLVANQWESVDGTRLTGFTQVSCHDYPDPDVPDQSRWQVTGTLGIAIR